MRNVLIFERAILDKSEEVDRPLSPTKSFPDGTIDAKRSLVAISVSKVFKLRLFTPINSDFKWVMEAI